MTKNQIARIVKRVRAGLASKAMPQGIDLQVEEGAYRQDNDWLYVIVSPKKPGIRAYDYVQVLSDVEKELKQSGLSNVLLVPALAD